MESNHPPATENVTNNDKPHKQTSSAMPHRNNTGQKSFIPRKITSAPYRANKPQAPLLPNTIYNAITQAKTTGFSRKDVRKISNIVKTKYSEQFGEGSEPTKIEQTEDGVVYQVYSYPDTMRKEIRDIVNWYFKVKKERKDKHERMVSREHLERLKKDGSPEYELALVKFNMAEEERRKKEKITQAEQLKKAKLKSKYDKQQTTSNPRARGGNNNNRFVKPNTGNKKDWQTSRTRPPRNNYNKDGAEPPHSNAPNDATNLIQNYTPPAEPVVQAPQQPLIETDNNAVAKPKPGFIDRFLNKIKGSDS